MIKLNKLNKYFNKGKQNEIHVINDTSLELPEKGLVTLLGDSGSGKTTLLNVIGGLDTVSGEINFKGQDINTYNSKTWDELRVNSIGYIFQNYYLLEERSVSDNIKIVLTMMGINDPEEIEYRIKYVLEAVNMYRYRNKRASDLSGGQKQRVAIARAIVKNPDVVIADEPTGNLDSNNSIEVLKIIKEISKDKLVVLVTHNIELASYYSDRIIKIADGKVVEDRNNDGNEQSLNYVDHNIYLKDLANVNSHNINIYSNEDLKEVSLTLVKINNNYYLKTSEANATVKILTDNSEVKLINEHTKDFKETFTKETSFNLEELEANKKPRTKKGIYTFKDSLIMALKKLTTLGKKGKAQIVALMALGVMFTISFLLLTSAIFINTSNVDYDKNSYALNYGGVRPTYEEYPDDIVVYNNHSVNFKTGTFTSMMYLNVYPKEAIAMESTDPNTVFIDGKVLDSDYEYYYLYEAFGISKEAHLLNQTLTISSIEQEFKIAGVVTTGNHAIYVDSAVLENALVNDNYFLNLLDDTVIINETLIAPPKEGRYGVYASEELYGREEDFYQFHNGIGGTDYKIIGYYTSLNPIANKDIAYASLETIKIISLENKYNNVLVYSKGVMPEGVVNRYDQQIEELTETRNLSLSASLTQSLIALGISVLIFYFLVRSSMTQRRKEISILRSLGISKGEVYRLFGVEYFIITTATSVVGVLIGSVVARAISSSFLGGFFNLWVSAPTFILAILLVYLVNVAVALIPVSQMLRKTPAQLLTNFDI